MVGDKASYEVTWWAMVQGEGIVMTEQDLLKVMGGVEEVATEVGAVEVKLLSCVWQREEKLINQPHRSLSLAVTLYWVCPTL